MNLRHSSNEFLLGEDLDRRAEETVKSKTNKLTVKKGGGSEEGALFKKQNKTKLRSEGSLLYVEGDRPGAASNICVQGERNQPVPDKPQQETASEDSRFGPVSESSDAGANKTLESFSSFYQGRIFVHIVPAYKCSVVIK